MENRFDPREPRCATSDARRSTCARPARGRRPLAIALTLLALACAPAALRAQDAVRSRPAPAPQPSSSDPNFGDVTDILAGQRILLPIDNLVVSGAFFQDSTGTCLPLNGNTCVQTPYFYLQTTAPDTLSLARTVVPDFATVSPWTPAAVPTTTNLGRVFNLPHDLVVRLHLTQGISPPFGIFPSIRVDDLSGGGVIAWVDDLIPEPYDALPSGLAPPNSTVLADFNKDGFADIATSIGNGTMRIATARDVNTPAMGVAWGPVFRSPGQPLLAMATGDFNGDGNVDIAGAYFDPSAGIGQLVIYSVDPQTLAITPVSSIAVPPMGPGAPNIGPNGVALAAGRFANVAADQLVLATNASDLTGVQVFSYSFDAQLNITQRSSFAPGIAATIVTARSASLDALGGQTAQVVLGYGSVPGRPDTGVDAFQVVRLDDQLNFNAQSVTTLPCTLCLEDLAIGNFTQGATPTLEIAILAVPRARGPNFLPDSYMVLNIQVLIYRVDPSSLAPALSSTFTVPAGAFPTLLGQAFRFAAGDTLGQSLRLGPPMKISIDSHIQPYVILGMPPMHIDWITPAQSSTPVVLNVSAVPDGFFASYQTEVVNGLQSASTSTTSYSYATMQGEGGGGANSLSLFGASLLSFSGTTQTATANAYTSFVQNQYNTYSGQQFDASTSTGFSDHVWYTAQRFNLWIYPVLGLAACPATEPQCDDSAKLPLALVFSGPDQVQSFDTDGATLEWYQPVHEPGNVLSYPWSESQLSAVANGFSELAASPVWFTDTSSQKQFAAWSAGGGSSVTSGSVTVHSRDKTSSVGASILGFGGGETVDAATSTAFGTVNSTVTTVGASSGLGVNKPGTFLNPGLYQYPVQNFVFGQNSPAGTAQQIPLSTTVQSTGVLQGAFIADPSGQLGEAGVWWRQAYAVPDVALNHPVRWTWTSATAPTGTNCLRIGPNPSASDCLTFNQPDLDDLPTSEFHWMRGFFVTPASGNGDGPQTVVATAGDQLLLQARVYNYSLTDMAPGTSVRVRFYGQPVTPDGSSFIGSSFLIGEQTIDPIPAFNSPTAGPNPNWSMASTTFDTTPYPDVALVFWVVVWMQDGAGNLVPEMADHGLTGLPGSLTSIADVPIEQFSNNVGYYNQPIYIAPPSTSAAPTPNVAGAPSAALAASATVAPIRAPRLIIEDVALFAQRPVPGDKTVVSATLRAGAQPVSTVHVRFFDGDPGRGGRMFDAELVPRIAAGQTWVVRVPFRPRSCGPRQIFVQVDDQTLATSTLPVFCPPEGRRRAATEPGVSPAP